MKILLAEDDHSIQLIAKMALQSVGGHSVMLAKDGVETLEQVNTSKPDLILLDIMMPRKNGFETCQDLKNSDHTKAIPVIFLTAKVQVLELQHGMSLGAIGYIIKPFDPLTLSKQIEEILKKNEAA